MILVLVNFGENMPAAKLYDSTQTLIQNIIIQGILKKKVSRNVIHNVPLLNYDIVQFLGKKLPSYIIRGLIFNSNEARQLWGFDEYYDEYYEHGWIATSDVLRSLPGTTGFFEFHSQIFDISLTQIFFKSVNFIDRGLRPLEREFIIEAICLDNLEG